MARAEGYARAGAAQQPARATDGEHAGRARLCGRAALHSRTATPPSSEVATARRAQSPRLPAVFFGSRARAPFEVKLLMRRPATENQRVQAASRAVRAVPGSPISPHPLSC